jgi:hypothetical protein
LAKKDIQIHSFSQSSECDTLTPRRVCTNAIINGAIRADTWQNI